MDLKPKTERLDARVPADIARAAELLRTGRTVAFPTETVYGLGANALSAEAVAKIFEAKKRPHWDPLIVHIADRAMLAQVTSLGAPPSAALSLRVGRSGTNSAFALMDAFWPGPLTLLLPRSSAIPDTVTAGRPLVGVRMPNHPVALELIRQAGIPIAAPSANLFGHTSPTTAAHVLADLDGRIDAILDGGPTEVGLESTVVEVTNQGVRVYRPGAVDTAMLEAVIHDYVEVYKPGEVSPSRPQALPSPGVGIRHYAPLARLILVEDPTAHSTTHILGSHHQILVDAIDTVFDGTEVIGVLLPDGWNPSCAQLIFRWGPWQNPETLAQRLYAGLRELDDRGATTIICPVPAAGGLGEAIRDRLAKAAK